MFQVRRNVLRASDDRLGFHCGAVHGKRKLKLKFSLGYVVV